MGGFGGATSCLPICCFQAETCPWVGPLERDRGVSCFRPGFRGSWIGSCLLAPDGEHIKPFTGARKIRFTWNFKNKYGISTKCPWLVAVGSEVCAPCCGSGV